MSDRTNLYTSVTDSDKTANGAITDRGTGDNRRVMVQQEFSGAPKSIGDRKVFLVLTETECVELAYSLLGSVSIGFLEGNSDVTDQLREFLAMVDKILGTVLDTEPPPG